MGDTDEEILERVRGEWYLRGSLSDYHYSDAARALELAPDDPVVVARCLAAGHGAMDPNAGYPAVAGPMVRRALELAEKLVPPRDQLDTVPARVMAYWIDHLRALEALQAETVTPEALAGAQARLDAGLELRGRPAIGKEEKQYDDWFRVEVLACRRAWEMVLAGPPYPAESIERLGTYLQEWDNAGFGPVAPLTRDATFRAFAKQVLAERTAAGSHPPPTSHGRGLFVRQMAEKGRPTHEELEGRWLLALWLTGIDQARFLSLCDGAIEDHAGSLRYLLGHGFDVNAHFEDGETLLHRAIHEGSLEAVKLLIAAGADPERKAKKGKETARKLAAATKKKAIIAALDGAATAGPTKLYDDLRAAAKATKVEDVWFIGSMYGMKQERIDPVGAMEKILANAPDSAQQILDNLGGGFAFDRYLIAHIVRAAGYKQDVTLKGPVAILKHDLNVSGDVICDGILVDEQGETSTVVAGDLRVHGLVTNADCVVGGSLRARDFVWGDYNDCSLAVKGDAVMPLLVMTDHSFEAAGEETIERRYEDASSDDVAAIFVPEVINDYSVDRGRVVARLRKNQPIVIGLAAAKAAKPGKKAKTVAKKPKKKATGKKAAKVMAKKKPAKKAAKKKR